MELYAGTPIQKNLTFFKKSQWYKQGEIDQLQNKKLRQLIDYAYTNIPYYHRIIKQNKLLPKDIRTVEDLQKLPFLTKDIIRKNFQDLIAKNHTKQAILNHTSGSSGEPLRYYISKESITIGWALEFRGWGWGGYELGDKRATLGFWRDYKTTATSADKNLSLIKRIRFALERNLTLSTLNMTEETMRLYVEQLERYNPKFLRGYPSALSILAQYIDENNMKTIRPNAVFSVAETLLPNQKKKIEETFGCPTFDHYGCRDGAANAMECEEHSGLHIGAEQCYIEVIKKDERADPLEMGEIISTDFHNYTMPFIRYRTGDCGTMSDEQCTCGRGLPLLRSVEGRIINQVLHSDGSYLSGLPLTDVFEYLEQTTNDTIKQYQVIQDMKDHLLIKIVKGKNYREFSERLITAEMKKHLGNSVVTTFEYLDQIPTTPGGKRLYIISELLKDKKYEC